MSEQIDKQQSEPISDEIQEVISYRPHWIVRKGNTIFFLILLLVLSLTWVIKYPDMINASAHLIALNPPKLIKAKAEGKLVRLFVSNDQPVSKYQQLGYLESTANYIQVITLRKWINEIIDSTRNDDYAILAKRTLPLLNDLGEIQTSYQQFQNELEQTKQTLANGYYAHKRRAIEKDIKYINTLKNNTLEQKQLLENDQQLQNKEYGAYEILAKEKVVAPLELNQYKSKVIAKEQSLKQVNAQITNADINSHAKKSEILELQKSIFDQQQRFRSSLLELKSQVDKWIQQYVLIAPEDGKVLFVSSLWENEWIANGQDVFFVEPRQNDFYAELMASQNGFGKIKTGQEVLLKVESYPSPEFGYLSGKINYISNIPSRKDSFLIKVSLPNGLVTNYNKPLFFRNDLYAQAEIITDNRRLFDRFIGEFRKVWQR